MNTNVTQQKLEFSLVVDVLKEKGVSFAIPYRFNTNQVNENDFRLIGVKITKKGKFYRANGKIISSQYANLALKFGAK